MKNIILLILISVVSISCKKEERFEADELVAKLRLKNETPYEIESALIKKGSSENIYGSLKPNEISEYKSFKESTYPYIKLRINNKDIEFQIQPFEASPTAGTNKPAKPLTCVITYSSISNSFDLHFVE
ncbi:MAG TPA: hypothetical protein VGB63_05510 [Pedobacter sp.]|jgi:hypothetical protein